MIARPAENEAAAYYARYIGRVPESEDVRTVMRNQLERFRGWHASISEERSLHRYAEGKWSLREVLNHINDAERLFSFRALWFARGFDSALPSFEQDIAAAQAQADRIAWERHAAEFIAVRQSTIALFEGMPEEAWSRGGIASGNRVTVRALAFITAGHLAYHLESIEEKYL